MFGKKWIVWVSKSWINPKSLKNANFKISTEEFLFAERRQMKILRQSRYVNASYEWPFLEQFMGSAANFFLPRETIKIEEFFQCLQTTQHKTNHKPHANQLIADNFCRQLVCLTLLVPCGLTKETKLISLMLYEPWWYWSLLAKIINGDFLSAPCALVWGSIPQCDVSYLLSFTEHNY